jgi:hypothetical protein
MIDTSSTHVMYNRSNLHAVPLWVDIITSARLWSLTNSSTGEVGTYSVTSINHPFSYNQDNTSYFAGGIVSKYSCPTI